MMNSDFVQRQAEELAQRVSGEPDNAARIKKAYRILFGRDAAAKEIQAGVDFLRAEPMRAYEERRAAKEKQEKEQQEKAKDAAGMSASKPTGSGAETAKVEASPGGDLPGPADAPLMADAMMAGVAPGAARKPDEKPVTVTHWGRYVRILMTSSEFMFIN
jgi:hypothetical protein